MWFAITDNVSFVAVLDSLLSPFWLGSKLCVAVLAVAVLLSPLWPVAVLTCHRFDRVLIDTPCVYGRSNAVWLKSPPIPPTRVSVNTTSAPSATCLCWLPQLPARNWPSMYSLFAQKWYGLLSFWALSWLRASMLQWDVGRYTKWSPWLKGSFKWSSNVCKNSLYVGKFTRLFLPAYSVGTGC